METIAVPPLEFMVWDVSGQDRLRSFWRHYYHGTCGVIFVVDVCDAERFPLVRKELHGILQEEELNHAVVLILANKSDQKNAVSSDELAKALDLQLLEQSKRKFCVQRSVALTGEGLKEGLVWLSKNMTPHTAKEQKEEQKEDKAVSSPK